QRGLPRPLPRRPGTRRGSLRGPRGGPPAARGRGARVTPEKNLIVNADDLGWSPGVNRAIAECHAHGVLTSASLMVTGRAVAEAVRLSRRHPRLSVGLHWDVWGEDEREFDLGDVRAVRDEFARQLETFYAPMGRLPTHVATH